LLYKFISIQIFKTLNAIYSNLIGQAFNDWQRCLDEFPVVAPKLISWNQPPPKSYPNHGLIILRIKSRFAYLTFRWLAETGSRNVLKAIWLPWPLLCIYSFTWVLGQESEVGVRGTQAELFRRFIMHSFRLCSIH